MSILSEIIGIFRCSTNKCEKTVIIHHELLKPDAQHQYTRLYRIYECPHCRKTRATITSPEPEETRFSEPAYWMVNQIPEPEGAKP